VPENIRSSINAAMVKDFKDTYYTGDNMFLVVCGDVDHSNVTTQANTNFSKIKKNPPMNKLPVKANEEKPIYTPSCIQIRDDDVDNAHVGVF